MKRYLKFINEAAKNKPSGKGVIVANSSDFAELEKYFNEKLLEAGMTSEKITQMRYVISKSVDETNHLGMPYFIDLYQKTFNKEFFEQHLKDNYSVSRWKDMLSGAIGVFRDIYEECEQITKININKDIVTRHFTSFEDMGSDVFSYDFETWDSVAEGKRLIYNINKYKISGNKFDALHKVISHMNLLKKKMNINILDMDIQTDGAMYIRFVITLK